MGYLGDDFKLYVALLFWAVFMGDDQVKDKINLVFTFYHTKIVKGEPVIDTGYNNVDFLFQFLNPAVLRFDGIDQISEADESPETDTDDTEEYRNKVFISSVKADKNMPRPESAEDGRVLGHGNEKAGNKPGDTVILQEYGENGEEQIEINLDGLPGEGPDNQDLSDDLERKSERPEPVSMDNSLKQEIVPGFGSEGQTNPITSGEDESSANHDMESAKTQSNAHVEDESEESNTSEEVITDGSWDSNAGPNPERQEPVGSWELCFLRLCFWE